MRSALLLALLIPGCIDNEGERASGGTTPPGGSDPGPTTPPTSNCPTGETCSDLTPNGLDFNGAQPVFAGLPNGWFSNVNHQIASGGTDAITLDVLGTNGAADVQFPYSAVSSDTSILSVVGSTGPVVSLLAHGGTTYLRILDPNTNELFDREAYASSSLATLLPVPTLEFATTANLLDTTASTFVFATGEQTIGVALLNAQTPAARLIDTSQTLTLDGADQTAWDQLHIPDATVGHHAIAVATAGATQMLDIEVVDHADAIEGFTVYGSIACFAATAHGAFISGIPWTFTVDGVVVPGEDAFSPNCVTSNASTFTVTASAGGQSTTYTTVASTSPVRRPSKRTPGERATRQATIDASRAARN
jgi:hypothetical protein